MWSHQHLHRIDWRSIPLVLLLMGISLLVISATTATEGQERFLTPLTLVQLRWFALGWGVFFFFAGMDYRKLKDWSPILYILILIALVGLFFVPTIQNVNRWYRIPGLGGTFQPSEYAKLIVVIALSVFLEKKARETQRLSTILTALALVLVPFALILKQPDLGTAMVLYPISLVMFYFGGIPKRVIMAMTLLACVAMIFVILMFTGILSHEEMRPYATLVLKEYQYERLNPNTYHQQAAQTAIALGGWTGSGWRKSEFTGRNWLPAPYTDSVFAAFGEEFGLIGVVFLLLIFFGLIYFSFQVTAVAKDLFGRLLSAGITVTLAMHILASIGMMTGLLPITGVPLMLVTYGGSSVLSTMTALGILQSIYSRRFMF